MNGTFRALTQYLRTPAAQSAEEFGEAIEEEIAFHLSERSRELVAEGMTEEQARQAALKRFGDAPRTASECHRAAVGGLAMWHRVHLGMTAVLAAAVALLWFARSDGFLTTVPALPPGIASMVDNDWTGDIQGTLVDEQDQPIAGANVLVVVKTWPDQSYFQRAYAAVTNSNGEFLVENVHPVDEHYEVQIAAVADDRLLKSSYHRRSSGTLEPVAFKLPSSSGFALQVETTRGDVLARAEVLPHGRVEPDGTEHLVYFDSAQPVVQRTNHRGQVELPYYHPGDRATVLLRAPQGDWQTHEVVVPPAGGIATIRASRAEHEAFEES